MSIVSQIRYVMAEKKINSISDLQRITGLSRNVLNKLFHEQKLEGLTLGTLHQLCKALHIQLGDLIEFDLSDPRPIRSTMGNRPKWMKESDSRK